MSDPVSPDDPTALLYAAIREVHDFPKPGIVFKDIMPILANPGTLRLSIDLFASLCRSLTQPIDKIVGIDARGFLFGAALAYKLNVGLPIPVRKAGKLPGKTEAVAYLA